MLKLYLMKKRVSKDDVGQSALFPVYKSDIANLAKISIGEIARYTVKKDRNYMFLKKYWALCTITAENCDNPALDHKEKVDEYCKIKAGYVDYRIVIDGVVNIKTKSISFAKSDEYQFADYYDRAVQIMAELLGVTVDELEEHWMEAA